jgi:hypothetical protein
MIGSALGRIAMADRMSVDQLKEALQNKTLPAYIAIPLIEEKMDMQDRMSNSMAMQQAPKQPPIAERVMQRAEASGIDQLPTNLEPVRGAAGGIVAFDEGGEVPRYANTGLVEPEFRTTDPAKINQAKLDILRKELADEQRKLGLETNPESKARIQANITAITSEINRVARSPSPQTSMKGFAVERSASEPIAKALQEQRRERVGEDAGLQPPLTMSGATMTPQQMLANAQSITDLVYPKSKAPVESTPEKAFEQTDKFMTMAKVDRDIFKKQGKDIAEERAGIAKDREEAKTFRILEAAAGVLSGTSPFATVNIGKGVSPAVQGLAADMKEFQKNERALRAAERDLNMSEQKFNLTRASDAQAQMIRDQDRVDKYNQNRAGLLGDLVKSYNSVEGQVRVAREYREGSQALERLRQSAPPDIVKLADRLKKDMPKATEQERLEAAAGILYPGKNLAAIIGAESKASQDIEEQFQYELLTDKKLKDINTKARAGDPEAKKELEAARQRIREQIYKNRPILSSRMGEISSVGGAPLPPGGSTQPGQFSVMAPNGRTYYFPTKEQADAFKAQIGG